MGEIDEPTFCDEFYYSNGLQVSHDTHSEIEQQVFSDLSEVSRRFSEYEEDHKLDVNAFSTVTVLRQKIMETIEKLQAQSLI